MRSVRVKPPLRERALSMSDLADLQHVLWPPGMKPSMKVWAVLDGARDTRIFGAVDGFRGEKCCLYAGTLPWQLQMTAPSLVQLEPGDQFTEFILRNGWGNSWGIFLHTDTVLHHLRRHLRSFLRVRDESGQKLIFRYYDPRVLRAYLPSCWKEELQTVFGPIERYLMESENSGEFRDFTFDGTHLKERSRPLISHAEHR